LTRASIFFAQQMDCRVKPGNDDPNSGVPGQQRTTSVLRCARDTGSGQLDFSQASVRFGQPVVEVA
jgi:hypothetical protein